jgi:hypothetical protein
MESLNEKDVKFVSNQRRADIEPSVVRRQTFPPIFTIAVLLYGDHLPLAIRCLRSIIDLPDQEKWELRIGLNDVCCQTRDYVNRLFDSQDKLGCRILLYDSTKNRGKYPVMRWMLHDSCNRVRAPYIMWFDDDSYIATPSGEWLNTAERAMHNADMCGQMMTTALVGNQHLWIRVQPWFAGKDLVKLKNAYVVPQFAVGGWWIIRTDVLNLLDWPPPNIVHFGGDYMLGEALRQNDYRLKNFREGVVINADFTDKDASAPRRGWTDRLHYTCGYDYEPPLTVMLHDATRNIPPEMLDYPGL